MKFYKLLILLPLFTYSLVAFPQNPIVVSVFPAPITMDTQHSFTVLVPQTTLKDVKKDWLRYLSKGSKGRASEINGEYFQAGAVNKNVSAFPFNIYSKLTETTEGVRLNAWLDVSSISIAQNQGQQLAIQKYLYDFSVQQYRNALQNELKAEQKKQSNLEKELALLIKKREKSANTVSKNQRSAERAQDAISTNDRDIRKSTSKISKQKENVDRNAADPNASKGAKKTLRELEDDKKNLQKQNESQGKNIDKMNKENRAEERSMAVYVDDLDIQAAALERQKEVVRNVQVKLDSIK